MDSKLKNAFLINNLEVEKALTQMYDRFENQRGQYLFEINGNVYM